MDEFKNDSEINDDVINETEDSEDFSDKPEFDEDGKLKEVKMKCSKEEYEKLILDNINFPYSIVNKEFSKYPWNVREDLNSAAMAGMIYAATKYDPKRANECKFISYAVHWIRFYIKEEIRNFYPVRFNQNFISKRNKVTKCITNYKNENDGQKPSIKYISEQVGMSERVVQNILNVGDGENFVFLSFNTPTENDKGNGDNESLNNDRLVNQYLEYENVDDYSFNNLDIKDTVDELKKTVPSQDFNVFYDYYFNGENFSDLAKKYNLKFPSSAAYLIKKCVKKCKELMEA